ncbi:MAG: hypothetical protein U1F76_22520 [Candidatus Competibacteraceae bacterium]
MKRFFPDKARRLGLLLVAITLPAIGTAANDDSLPRQPVPMDAPRPPATLAVSGELPPPPPGVTDLKFRDLFKLPIGPYGLEPTEKLLGLDGKPVRLVGYMIKQEEPTPGVFILSPLPVSLGHEDEALADDLPASMIFVHLEGEGTPAVPYVAGLLQLIGVLSVGNREEADGRVSVVRLRLDPALVRALLTVAENTAAAH